MRGTAFSIPLSDRKRADYTSARAGGNFSFLVLLFCEFLHNLIVSFHQPGITSADCAWASSARRPLAGKDTSSHQTQVQRCSPPSLGLPPLPNFLRKESIVFGLKSKFASCTDAAKQPSDLPYWLYESSAGTDQCLEVQQCMKAYNAFTTSSLKLKMLPYS